MAGKVSVMELNPDMTFRELRRKTYSNNVELSKNDSPSFALGRSVFREIIPKWKQILFGKKERRMIIHIEGASSCFAIDQQSLETYESDIWNRKEKERYVNKLATKSKAEQKAIETWQFYILAGLGLFCIILQILVLRGIRVL